MGTDKVIFVGGTMESNRKSRDRKSPVWNRKYVMRMRTRKFRNTPSGVFSPEVIVCAIGTFCITTRVVLQVPWLHVTEGHPKGVHMSNRKLRNIPLVGPFYRKLATGSDVIFPRIFISSSTKCWLWCSLGRPRLPLSLVICPFYFHNYM